jgi:hypothetical protein
LSHWSSPLLSVVPLQPVNESNLLQHDALELESKYTPNPFGPCGPVGPVTPCAPALVYPDPLGPIDPVKFIATLAVNTRVVKNDARADILAVVTDVAKFVFPNGYDCMNIPY